MNNQGISNKNHPERMPDEVFFNNSSIENFAKIPWESKRMGQQAYSLLGVEIEKGELDNRSTPPTPITDVFPVFVKIEEVKKKLKGGEEAIKILVPHL